MTIKKYDVLVIGAGIIGTSIAQQLSQYVLKIAVCEKNCKIAGETTEVNSGIIHGGFDAAVGSQKAKLNVAAKQQWLTWFKKFNFPYRKIDSLVIAFNNEEKALLHDLYNCGIANGLAPSELTIIDQTTVLGLEPRLNKSVVGALLCTSSYIIDQVKLSEQLINYAIDHGTDLLLNAQVTNIIWNNNVWNVMINNQTTIEATYIVNAAGHWADDIAALAGCLEFKLTSCRGEYRILERTQGKVVNHIVFLIPTIHGKGVLVSPTVDGYLMVGPTTEPVLKTETKLISKKMFDHIGAIGLKIIPDLDIDQTVKVMAGSRSIDVDTHDFVIKASSHNNQFINVVGIQSPGISAAPAIAELVVEILANQGLALVFKN